MWNFGPFVDQTDFFSLPNYKIVHSFFDQLSSITLNLLLFVTGTEQISSLKTIMHSLDTCMLETVLAFHLLHMLNHITQGSKSEK